MRVLLVGGTGMLGRPTVPLLAAAGHEVVAVSRDERGDVRLREAGAQPVRADVFDRSSVLAAAGGVEAIVNIATRIPPQPAGLRARAWEQNHRLRRDASRVLAAAAIANGARFVQESFAATYRDHGSAWITEDQPLEPVANTLTVPDAEASAAAVTEAGAAGVALRFGLFYGAGDPATRERYERARKGRLLLPGPEGRYASMVYVEDAAAAVVAALDVPAGVYNVVEDEPLTIGEHARVLGDLLGTRRIKPLPPVLGRIPVLRAISRSQRISNERFRAATGWRPRAPSVREGWRLVLAEWADAQP